MQYLMAIFKKKIIFLYLEKGYLWESLFLNIFYKCYVQNVPMFAQNGGHFVCYNMLFYIMGRTIWTL